MFSVNLEKDPWIREGTGDGRASEKEATNVYGKYLMLSYVMLSFVMGNMLWEISRTGSRQTDGQTFEFKDCGRWMNYSSYIFVL